MNISSVFAPSVRCTLTVSIYLCLAVFNLAAEEYSVKSSKKLFSHSGPLDYIARSHMIELPDGNWMIGYPAQDHHNPKSSDGYLIIRFSDDEGRTWTEENKRLDGSDITGLPENNKWYGFYFIVAPNDDILCFFHNTGFPEIRQMRSTDNGESWNDEGQTTANDPWSDIRDDNTIYAFCRTLESWNSTDEKCHVRKSTDNGNTWDKISSGLTHSDGHKETGIVKKSESEWTMLMRESGRDDTFKYTSTNKGVDWNGPESFKDEVGFLAEFRNTPFINRGPDGRQFLASREYVTGKEDQRLVLLWTDDGGDTWGKLRVTNSVPDCGRPSVLKRDNGEFYYVGYIGESMQGPGGTNLDTKAEIWEFVIEQNATRIPSSPKPEIISIATGFHEIFDMFGRKIAANKSNNSDKSRKTTNVMVIKTSTNSRKVLQINNQWN